MKAIAVDDEPMALEVICSLATKLPLLELKATFTDACQALDYLHQEPVDLLLLDINMPDISGLEFVRSMPKKSLVIFTTAYAEHAVTSFELDAVDYLLKPFSLARFVKACHKANELWQLRRQSAAEKDFVFLKTGPEQVKVFFEEILYLEASGNYITFVLENERLLTRMTFGEAQQLLPPGDFIQVHRSYLVALHKINKIERHQVHLRGYQVPVGASFLARLQLSK